MNASKLLLTALLTFGALAAAPATASACGGYGVSTVEDKVAAAAELHLADRLDDDEWVWVRKVKLSKDGERATAVAELYSEDSTRNVRLHFVRDGESWELAPPRPRPRA